MASTLSYNIRSRWSFVYSLSKEAWYYREDYGHSLYSIVLWEWKLFRKLWKLRLFSALRIKNLGALMWRQLLVSGIRMGACVQFSSQCYVPWVYKLLLTVGPMPSSGIFVILERGGRKLYSLTHTNTQRMACSSRLGAHCIEGCSPKLSQRLIEHPWHSTLECSYNVWHLGLIGKFLQDVGYINTKNKSCSGVKEKVPLTFQPHMFDYVFPSWWNYLRGSRRRSLTGGSTSLACRFQKTYRIPSL